jgi:SAM-dependent methyltransferase
VRVGLTALALAVAFAGFAPSVAAPAAENILLPAADLAALSRRFAGFSDDLPSATQLGVEKILAFEEHRLFVYVRGSGPSGERRLIFCKPSAFVIADTPAAATGPWRLTVAKGEARLNGAPMPSGGVVREDRAELTVNVAKRTFTITLSQKVDFTDTIAVKEGGETVLAKRLLAAGVLPHGEAGVRQLERWESSYRRSRTPGWDVGRPASELKRAVEEGAIRPGRALVLGCGGGTNAIYLAGKGFEVTGVDVAPSALTLAEERARAANVRVRWLVADVLAVPDIGPFDFIFDRGCYHHVRRYNAAGFAAMVTRLSRPETHFLLLAGNANEPRPGGPPRVEETDIVNDFARTWDIVWLKEIRFDSRNPGARRGAWAWSALMRRNGRSG